MSILIRIHMVTSARSGVLALALSTWGCSSAMAASRQVHAAQLASDTSTYTAAECPSCATWDAPTPPRRIFGNTYFVGTQGLSAILVTSPAGHVLIDGGLPSSAPRIAKSIRELGFRVEDVRQILNSHAHYDHAGGIAALQRMSGAVVTVRGPSLDPLRTGRANQTDPQLGYALPYAPARDVHVIKDGDVLRVGPLRLTAHATAGHTPGGTSWSWRSCDGDECHDMVYADSQTPISDDEFLFTSNTRYPSAIADFRAGQQLLERISCDILITPHPGASRMFERIAGEEGAKLVDRTACASYARNAGIALDARIKREQPSR